MPKDTMDKFEEKLKKWDKLERKNRNPVKVLRKIDWKSGDLQIIEPYEGIETVKNFLFEKLKSGKILDVGCGSGKHTILFANEGFDSYGIDISKNAIRLSRKISKRMDTDEKASFLISDIKKLPFKEETFNSIIDHNLLIHIPMEKWNEYLRNVYRVLKPGGFLCLLELSVKTNETDGFEPTSSKNEFTRNGGETCFHFVKKNEIKKYFTPEFQILKFKEERDRVEGNIHLITILKKRDRKDKN